MSAPCDKCAELGKHSFGEKARGTTLLWFESFHCPHCRNAWEVDGRDRLPEELRARELLRHGQWAVEVVSGSAVVILKVARELLGLSLEAASVLGKQLPGPILPGTRGEAERILNGLTAAGVECKLVRLASLP